MIFAFYCFLTNPRGRYAPLHVKYSENQPPVCNTPAITLFVSLPNSWLSQILTARAVLVQFLTLEATSPEVGELFILNYIVINFRINAI